MGADAQHWSILKPLAAVMRDRVAVRAHSLVFGNCAEVAQTVPLQQRVDSRYLCGHYLPSSRPHLRSPSHRKEADREDFGEITLGTLPSSLGSASLLGCLPDMLTIQPVNFILVISLAACAVADDGDDFSNNLISDLAPWVLRISCMRPVLLILC